MVKAYTTRRIGNNGREYVGVNINNRQFEIPGRQITGLKTKKTVIPRIKKATTTTYNPNLYGKRPENIKQIKTTVKTKRKQVIKK